MFNLEYKNSKGRASRYMYHKDIVDYYLLLNDDKRIFSERPDWTDYCLMIEIDNLNKDISIKKSFFISANQEISCYDCRFIDYKSIVNKLYLFLEEVKIMLDIEDYRIILHFVEN